MRDWKDNNRISTTAPDDFDNDGDDIPLFMEYALASDPKHSSRRRLPYLRHAGGKLLFTYDKARSNINYTVEVSTDLVNWSTSNITQESANGTEITVSTPISPGEKKFMRLQVSQ